MVRYKNCLLFSLCFAFGSFSCDDEASDDCAGDLCPFVGNWQLSDVTIDGSDTDDEYPGYQLKLQDPEGNELSADYTRAFGNGQNESGTWTLANNNDVIVLSMDGEEEEYIVQEVVSNRLVLVLNRDSIKPGPAEIVYVFSK
jgi:hypothetical protein